MNFKYCIHPLSRKEIFSVMLWCSIYLFYTALLEALKCLIFFRLLENKTLEMFSMRGRRKSKHKFVETKVCKAEEVRKYFVSNKIENEVFG